MITIFDVAKKAQVSVITVSRLMNNPGIVSSQTAKRIYRAMEILNYQPSNVARSLMRKKTNTIGVIMPDIKDSFFNSWFRSIEEYAGSHNFNLILYNTDEDLAKEINFIKKLHLRRVDGIIVVPSSEESIKYLIKTGIPFILFDRHSKNIKTSYVASDHYQGAFDATEYLVKLGHKRIAVLRVPHILYPDTQRYLGFRDAMKKHNIDIPEHMVCYSDLDEGHVYNITRMLLTRKDKPTAIVAFNSLLTKGAIKYIQSMKILIPDDVSLIGFDEFPGHDIFHPRITYIVQQVDSLGKNIISSLIDMIQNPDSSKQINISLRPGLVIGESCKKIA